MIPSNLVYVWNHPEGRTLDKILYIFGNIDMPLELLQLIL